LINAAFERWAGARGGEDRGILAVSMRNSTLQHYDTIEIIALRAETASLFGQSTTSELPQCLQPKSFGARSSSLY
jgi:hypothetical protein